MREIRIKYRCPHCGEAVHVFLDSPRLVETNYERRTDVVTCYRCFRPADVDFRVEVSMIGGD